MQQTFGHPPQRLTPTSLIPHPQYPACLRHVSPPLLASRSGTIASGTVIDIILAGCTTCIYCAGHLLQLGSQKHAEQCCAMLLSTGL